ncbi:uncharacterized protein APUU_20348A [Aspergillus puulaauensis]|uniref:Uncharacterized protein n=1 Tax=Aspergillus puulaauensis TaxID=1220207 RepID=A0A7R8AIB4_9EURO|nr:uncharacterized protein APUU_20348A [Aspergillus puulaauensis]BCS19916.1 hypothetical protein APUU_20348A [Aspergillus puulaauensis]
MQLGNILTLLCLSTGALSFKVRAYTEGNCKGEAKDINVWDNTCRGSGIPKTHSFRVLAYGGRHQRAAFYTDGSCNPFGKDWTDWWADGGSNVFKKDRCIDIGFGAYSMGSRSA